jgi:DNA-directed RNA polymerase alpha subunit
MTEVEKARLMDDDDDKIEQAIVGRASQDGAFAVAYALLRIARALNTQPLTVDELGEPIEKVFVLSNRASRVLADANINKVRDLTEKSRLELLRLPEVGTETLREIERTLANRGVTLR